MVFFILCSRRCSLVLVKTAQWLQRWMNEVAEASHVHTSTFEEGLGRVMYVAGALECERPFLSPLYRFLVLHPRNTVQRLPAYVIFMLRYLSLQIHRSRHYDCAAEVRGGHSTWG